MTDIKMVEGMVEAKIRLALSKYESDRLRAKSDLVFRVTMCLSWTVAVALVTAAIVVNVMKH